jgi:splicing factor U2AF 35 kDa subunit
MEQQQQIPQQDENNTNNSDYVYSAEHLADIYGTEKDKVNCSFYWKIGACRHQSKCSKLHNKPTLSQTLLVPHMYQNPLATPMINPQTGEIIPFDQKFLEKHFEDFFEDILKNMKILDYYT